MMQGGEEKQLKKAQPGRWPPDPSELVKKVSASYLPPTPHSPEPSKLLMETVLPYRIIAVGIALLHYRQPSGCRRRTVDGNEVK